MSKNDTADSITQAREAIERGIENLRQLRARHADELAERDQKLAEHAAELALAEEEFSRAEAEQRHQTELTEARTQYATESERYRELCAAADEAVSRVDAVTLQAARVFAAAVDAELARVEAISALKDSWRRLNKLDGVVGEPPVTPARLHSLRDGDAAFGIVHAAVLIDPGLEKKLNQLRWT